MGSCFGWVGPVAMASPQDTKYDAIYCGVCHMWVNGPIQYEDHLLGSKHKKNQRRGTRAREDRARQKSDAATTQLHPELALAVAIERSRDDATGAEVH